MTSNGDRCLVQVRHFAKRHNSKTCRQLLRPNQNTIFSTESAYKGPSRAIAWTFAGHSYASTYCLEHTALRVGIASTSTR
ncbi:hypothetical protein R69608_07816 [Paraburkholderia nemoris]|nr:hypothetical protein R69608_07816 [Paraburkholderia nemoris]